MIRCQRVDDGGRRSYTRCSRPNGTPITYDPRLPERLVFLQTIPRKQIALFGEGTFSFHDHSDDGCAATRRPNLVNTRQGSSGFSCHQIE